MLRSISSFRRLFAATIYCTRPRELQLLCSLVVLILIIVAPSVSSACGPPAYSWLQPTTVQKGDSFLVTGTGFNSNQALTFTFLNTNSYPLMYIRYTTGPGNGNCVVNQENIDSSNFKKSTYSVSVSVLTRTRHPTDLPDLTYPESLSTRTLNVVARTTTAPVSTPSNCDQTAHAWFGPSRVVFPQEQLYVAAVAKPGKRVYYYFDNPNTHFLNEVIESEPAHINCVVDDVKFSKSPGVYGVHAGFWDETGHYDYVDLGTLTVVEP